MTIRTLKTNADEAKRLESGDQSFVIRSSKDYVSRGDLIQFQLFKQGRPAPCKLMHKMFMVTAIANWNNAPVERGYQLISFKEVYK